MNYVQKMEAEKQAILGIAERVTRQFDVDTCCLALNRCKEAWGWKRISEFLQVWEDVRLEYSPLLTRGPEQDVAAEHLYRELCRIAEKHQEVLTHEQRYPDMRKETYKGRRQRG